jgi:hypothetical protein
MSIDVSEHRQTESQSIFTNAKNRYAGRLKCIALAIDVDVLHMRTSAVGSLSTAAMGRLGVTPAQLFQTCLK